MTTPTPTGTTTSDRYDDLRPVRRPPTGTTTSDRYDDRHHQGPYKMLTLTAEDPHGVDEGEIEDAPTQIEIVMSQRHREATPGLPSDAR